MMDLRDQKWHGQLSISGVGKPSNRSGSIISLFGEFLKDLQAANPRALTDGKQIVLRISDKPFGADKADSSLDRVLEVEAGLETPGDVEDGPHSGESFDDYYDRLILEGMSTATAQFLACDWFDREQDAELLGWLSDPKAIRFRQLNSLQAEYDKATPEEYAMLKHYVVCTFPNMVSGLVFRVA